MSVISRKNQVTIPVEVLRDAGLRQGDDVRIRAAGMGRVEVIETDDLVGEYAGKFDASVYPPGCLEKLRHEWPT